jgi:RsiW-degrading membrane proteinase PrsW (M82 family)
VRCGKFGRAFLLVAGAVWSYWVCCYQSRNGGIQFFLMVESVAVVVVVVMLRSRKSQDYKVGQRARQNSSAVKGVCLVNKVDGAH